MSEAIAMEFDPLENDEGLDYSGPSLRTYMVRIFACGFVSGLLVGALAAWAGGFPG